MKLYIIKITEGEWSISVDNATVGTTENGISEFAVGINSVLIGISPLYKGKNTDKIYLPAYINTANIKELPFCYSYGNDALYFKIEPNFVYRDVPPYIIAECQVSRMKAVLYYDKGANIVIEAENRQLIFSFTLPFVPENAEMQQVCIGAKMLLLAKLKFKAESYSILISASDSRLIYYGKTLSQEIQSERIIFYEATDDASMCIKRICTENGIISSEYINSGINAESSSLLTTAKAFITALKHKAEAHTMSLLTNELKNELNFNDIINFFGDFDCIIDELCTENGTAELALLYENEKRIHKYAFKGNATGNLINDIDELF